MVLIILKYKPLKITDIRICFHLLMDIETIIFSIQTLDHGYPQSM